MIAPLTPRKERYPRTTTYRLYQFKITLQDITPLIWRRIQVPETYSFWDFHVAIQDAMGWNDSHLHNFTLTDPKNGKQVRIEIPAEVYGECSEGALADWAEFIADYFTPANPQATYEYDFGDGWGHDIVFEGIFPKVPRRLYPKCLEGERNCPPEDCGGVMGYAELVEAMKNPRHPRRQEFIEWLGCKYDPERFNPDRVRFDNPRLRYEMAFEK
jgi:hypothetical protein